MTNAAMQLLGGNGYSREHPLERMLRDARMFTFGGGSSRDSAHWHRFTHSGTTIATAPRTVGRIANPPTTSAGLIRRNLVARASGMSGR